MAALCGRIARVVQRPATTVDTMQKDRSLKVGRDIINGLTHINTIRGYVKLITLLLRLLLMT